MPEPMERVARALCRADGHPEDIKFESKPMWVSYTEEATMVLQGLKADVMVEALAMVIGFMLSLAMSGFFVARRLSR